MIDVHCHLNFHSFEKDYDNVIKNAFEKGVKKIINVGTQIESSQKAVELAQKYTSPAGELFAIVGIHPHHADKPSENWIKELETLGKSKKVVAIGEVGLDYFKYKSNGIVDPKLQKEAFIKQVELAYRLKLPLQIHNRHAGKDIIDILKNHKKYLKDSPGMFHCFAGSKEILKSALEMGFYIGFDGNITYKGLAPGENTDLKDLAKYTPIDRILVETDSPFLTPEPLRGSRNMPEYVIIIAKFISEIKGISFDKFEAQTTKNANNLFNLNT